MNQVTLGRTGMTACRLGLGAGGFSCLGTRTGKSRKESAALVRLALDQGITLFDTAESYGTEEILGEALAGDRDKVLLATKWSQWDEAPLKGPAPSLEASLRRLRTDRVDIFFVHAATPQAYPSLRDKYLPLLQDLKKRGLCRFIGVTERFHYDPRHEMLPCALEDGVWDVIMAGYSMLNPSARAKVLPKAQKTGTAVLGMFAVRNAFRDPDRRGNIFRELHSQGKLPWWKPGMDPFESLVKDGIAGSVSEAAYRFSLFEPGMGVTLTGTGSQTHLLANLEALKKGPLPEETREELLSLFSLVDSVSGQ